MQIAAVYGAPPVDFLPQQDPVAYEKMVQNAERLGPGYNNREEQKLLVEILEAPSLFRFC